MRAIDATKDTAIFTAIFTFGVTVFGVAGCSANKGGGSPSPTALTGDASPSNGGDGGGLALDANGGGGFEVNLEASIDPEKDNDGDGWVFKEDCNDNNKEVNPGAYEVLGDGVDNDCDGLIDNPEPDCDNALLKYDTADPLDFARSMGLCRFTKAEATGKEKRWGVIKAELVRADGTSTLDLIQSGVLKKWGANVGPRQGKNFAVLSSGTARTPDYPGWIEPLTPSFQGTSEVDPPVGWPKNSAGCQDPTNKKANDSANLKLTIRVPTNAKAFLFDFDFYSSEYITYVCSMFNDSFVAILDSKAPLDAKYAKNISFDAMGDPINVNSGFFEVCTPGTSTTGMKVFACAKTTKELEGTGFTDDLSPTENGATSWLETRAPVVPGETITLQFMIWDTEDHILDSTVLLDNWRWDAKGTTAPTTDRPK
ncbi:MAG: hypothetical protein NVSMB1_07930 [Polyangiales bacterium]